MQTNVEIDGIASIEQALRLAGKWKIRLDQNYASRYAFASYIYLDSEWSGIKIDENSFIVTDGR